MKRKAIFATLTALILSVSPIVRGEEPSPEKSAEKVQPRLINLDVTNADAASVIDSIAKQAGVVVSGYEPTWQNAAPVTISVKNARFWPTVLEFAKQTKL